MVSATESHPAKRPRFVPQRKGEGKELVAERPLNRMETRFCQLVAQGWPLHRCYMQATGSQGGKANAEKQAWRWRMRPAVEQAIIAARARLTDATAMTRAEKTNLLSTMARDPVTPAAVRVGAIQVHNRMTGDDEPVRVTVSGRVVFTVDPIGDGTRGQNAVHAEEPQLPAGETTLELTP